MYIAMNRFKIVICREKDFERIWKERETHLDDVSGFLEFHLVKGGTEETHTLYASHSTWKSQTDFVKHIKEQVSTVTFTWGTQFLKVLKLFLYKPSVLNPSSITYSVISK